MRKIVILITFLVLLSGCIKVQKLLEENTLVDNETNLLTLDVSTPDGYKVFASYNQKLVFFYKNDWKCNEVVDDTRIDCYPLDRVEEEYDAGLDKNTVYHPNISFYDDNGLCSLIVDDKIILETTKEPLIYNEQGDNYYGLFYKKFNNCLTKITTSPDIDTIEKLEEIIK